MSQTFLCFFYKKQLQAPTQGTRIVGPKLRIPGLKVAPKLKLLVLLALSNGSPEFVVHVQEEWMLSGRFVTLYKTERCSGPETFTREDPNHLRHTGCGLKTCTDDLCALGIGLKYA